MYDYLEREKNLINYYVKNINAINDELDELLKNDNVKKYLELSKCDEVREFLKVYPSFASLSLDILLLRIPTDHWFAILLEKVGWVSLFKSY